MFHDTEADTPRQLASCRAPALHERITARRRPVAIRLALKQSFFVLPRTSPSTRLMHMLTAHARVILAASFCVAVAACSSDDEKKPEPADVNANPFVNGNTGEIFEDPNMTAS